MQITSAESTTIDIRLTETLTTGSGGIGDRGGLQVRVRANGLTGRGETAPIPGMEGPGLEAIAVDIDRWCNAIAGSSIEDAIAGIEKYSGSPLARFAIHTALIDVLSQEAGAPLAQFLRAGSPGSVKANGLVTESNPGAVHSHTQTLVAEGMTAIKLKVGAVETAQDVTRIIAASEAAGARVSLRLDANRSWTRETTERVIGRVGIHRIDFIEDPTAHLAEYGAIENETGVSVAIDLPVTHDPDTIVAEAGVGIIVVKPAAVGGVDRVMALARAHPDHRIIVTSSIDREIGLAAAIHAAAALAHGDDAHGVATGGLVRNMPDSLMAHDGLVTVPEGSGVWQSEDR